MWGVWITPSLNKCEKIQGFYSCNSKFCYACPDYKLQRNFLWRKTRGASKAGRGWGMTDSRVQNVLLAPSKDCRCLVDLVLVRAVHSVSWRRTSFVKFKMSWIGSNEWYFRDPAALSIVDNPGKRLQGTQVVSDWLGWGGRMQEKTNFVSYSYSKKQQVFDVLS